MAKSPKPEFEQVAIPGATAYLRPGLKGTVTADDVTLSSDAGGLTSAASCFEPEHTTRNEEDTLADARTAFAGSAKVFVVAHGGPGPTLDVTEQQCADAVNAARQPKTFVGRVLDKMMAFN